MTSTLEARTKFIQLALKYGFIFLDGIPRFVSTCNYEKYSVVKVNDIVYMSSIDNNINNTPSASSPFWKNSLTFAMDIICQGRISDKTGFVDPVGSIQMWITDTPPSGWIFCDGSTLDKNVYPDLFDIIGYSFGGSGDYFDLPDFSEASPVGVGTRDSSLPAHDVFTLGQFKDDQLQGHHHVASHFNGNNIAVGSGDSNYGYRQVDNLSVDGCGSPSSDGTNGTPRVGTVTRGKRFGVMFIIKY